LETQERAYSPHPGRAAAERESAVRHSKYLDPIFPSFLVSRSYFFPPFFPVLICFVAGRRKGVLGPFSPRVKAHVRACSCGGLQPDATGSDYYPYEPPTFNKVIFVWPNLKRAKALRHGVPKCLGALDSLNQDSWYSQTAKRLSSPLCLCLSTDLQPKDPQRNCKHVE